MLNAAYSIPSSLNATSIRVDHYLNSKITLFARYNHAPSYNTTRRWEELAYDNANTNTFTAGATILIAPPRLTTSARTGAETRALFITSLRISMVGFRRPLYSVPSSSPYSFDNGQALLYLGSIGNGDMDIREGSEFNNVQRQLNFVDTFSWAVGVHQFKFGIDYRHLRPTSGQSTGYGVFSTGYAQLVAGTIAIDFSVDDLFSVTVHNYSLFAQDMEGNESSDTDVWVAVGDQHTAGLGNLRPTALRAARNLRLECACNSAGSL